MGEGRRRQEKAGEGRRRQEKAGEGVAGHSARLHGGGFRGSQKVRVQQARLSPGEARRRERQRKGWRTM
jgi:hypothetical protein